MKANTKIIDLIYQLTFGNLEVADFISLSKSERKLFVDTIFKSRAHCLLYKLLNKYEDSYKKFNFYIKAKNVVNFYTYHSMVHLEDSHRLNKILNHHKIKFIFLKGVHLLHTYYDDIIDRPIRDIDILVQKKEIKRVVYILKKNGYKFEYDVNDSSLDYFLANSYDIPVLIGNNGSRLEVHFSIERSSETKNCVFTERFFTDSKEIEYGNNHSRFLSEEDLILHLIYHGLKKQGPDVGILFICDIYKILSTNKYDHSVLVEKAKLYNLLPHLKIITSILSLKSKNSFFQHLNNKINFKVDKNIINSCEYLFIRNELLSEEIKLFQLFRNRQTKKISSFYRLESIIKQDKLNKDEKLRLLISYLVKAFKHLKIVLILFFRILFFRSIRHEFFKVKSILIFINDP